MLYSQHVVGHGEDVFTASAEQGLEGIISKRVDARYAQARSPDWVKTKHAQSDEFVIVGYTEPRKSRVGFGSLLMATRGEDGATAITRRVTLDVPGRAVTVADTVGAGDTFTAGLHAWLQQAGRLDKGGIAGLSRDDLARALDYAVTAASITVSRPGADPPWRHEMPG